MLSVTVNVAIGSLPKEE